MELHITCGQGNSSNLISRDNNGNEIDVRRVTEIHLYDSRDEHVVGALRASYLHNAIFKPVRAYAPKGGKIPVHRAKKDEYLCKEHIFMVESGYDRVLWCDLAYLDMESQHKYHKTDSNVILCTITLTGIDKEFTGFCWTNGCSDTMDAWAKYSEEVDKLKHLNEPNDEEFDAAIQAVQNSFRRWRLTLDAANRYSVEDYLAGKPFKV